MMSIKNWRTVIEREQAKAIGIRILWSIFTIILTIIITKYLLLGAALSVSASVAARWIAAVYNAWRTGRTLRVAVSAVLGAAGWTWIVVDILISVGIGYALGSGWVHNW